MLLPATVDTANIQAYARHISVMRKKSECCL